MHILNYNIITMINDPISCIKLAAYEMFHILFILWLLTFLDWLVYANGSIHQKNCSYSINQIKHARQWSEIAHCLFRKSEFREHEGKKVDLGRRKRQWRLMWCNEKEDVIKEIFHRTWKNIVHDTKLTVELVSFFCSRLRFLISHHNITKVSFSGKRVIDFETKRFEFTTVRSGRYYYIIPKIFLFNS